MDSLNQMERLLEGMAENIDGDVDLYMIGGGAMMYLGGKLQTKDLDLVVRSADEYSRAFGALIRMGFESTRPGAGYDKMNLSGILEDGTGRRIDLFNDRVCRKLRLSEGMASRSVVRCVRGGITLRTVAPEDILIFKSITERPGDREDCMRILETVPDLDWKAVLAEVKSQLQEGDDVWITWIADGFYAIREQFGAYIPILDEFIRMADSFLERWECEFLEASGDKPI